MNDGKSTGQSPYRRGADAGLILGVYLCVIFFATAYSMTYPILSPVSLVLIAGVPVFIYMSLRRSYITDMAELSGSDSEASPAPMAGEPDVNR